jgi:predicted NAD-dependent protein-ADP-ribosyltransferase YbiA (DUF1768 family)
MDIKSGNKYPSCALSNFAPHPFMLDDVKINSMEGFLQSLKFKNEDMQVHICTLVGFNAKKSGSNKNWQSKQILYWKGTEIKRDSQEYQNLLDRAYEAVFTQNKSARAALLATNDATLTHSIGRRKMSETVLTAREFCSRLMRIRRWIKESEYMVF